MRIYKINIITVERNMLRPLDVMRNHTLLFKVFSLMKVFLMIIIQWFVSTQTLQKLKFYTSSCHKYS